MSNPSPSSGDHEKPTPYEIAQLAAILAGSGFGESRLFSCRDLSERQNDERFFGALKRAEWLLQRAAAPDDDIHAYRIFQEGVLYSPEEIADEFKTIGWRGLQSINTVKELMKELRFKMEELPATIPANQDQNFNATIKAATERIRVKFTELENDDAVQAAFRNFGDRFDRFILSLDRRPVGRYGLARVMDNGWYDPFLKWCFSKDAKGAKFRPHEILRFAAMQEWCSDRLLLPHSSLQGRFIPYPPKSLERFSFTHFEESLIE